MGRMDLEDAESSLTRTTRGRGKRVNHFLYSISCECLRHGIGSGERQCAWGGDLFPPAFALRNNSLSFPWPARTRLATGVGELHSGNASLFVDEIYDTTQHFDV